MGLKFEWDRRKAVLNIKKHRVSFEDAATAFGDPLSVTIHDPKHSDDEDRFLLLGETKDKKFVVVLASNRLVRFCSK